MQRGEGAAPRTMGLGELEAWGEESQAKAACCSVEEEEAVPLRDLCWV
jgi:hypothetical protein